MDSGTLLMSNASLVGPRDSPTHFNFRLQNSWKLMTDKAAEFWQNYLDSISYPQLVHYIGEIPQDFVPIVFIGYFSFRYEPSEEDVGEYLSLSDNDDFIGTLITGLQSTVMEKLDIVDPYQNGRLATIVTETVSVDERQRLKTVVLRLQMPYITVTKDTQDRYIRPSFINRLMRENVLGKLQNSPLGDWESIFSPQQLYAPIPMYRSSALPQQKVLQVETLVVVADYSVGDDLLNEVNLHEIGINPSAHKHFQSPVLFDFNTLRFHQEHDTLLFILSINYHLGQLTRVRQEPIAETPMINPQTSNIVDVQTGSYSELGSYNVFGDVTQVAPCFMSMLNNRRANDISSLIAIAQALCNIYEFEPETGLALLKEFAARGDRWDEFEVEENYYHNLNENKGLSVLGWMALLDNEEHYQEWLVQHCEKIHAEMAQCTELKVALGFYTFYWLQVLTCQGDSRSARSSEKWYFYRRHRHRWIDDHRQVKIKAIIQMHFRDRVRELRLKAASKQTAMLDDNERGKQETVIKGYGELLAKLETERFINPLIKTLFRLFYKDNFDAIKDHNPFILGCSNGVIETTDSEVKFRPGRPDDYVTMSTRVNYPRYVNPNDPTYKAMHYWFKQLMYSDEDIREFMYSLARCIRGRNFMKEFIKWVGERGNEGKSSVKRLLEYTFGDYTFTPPTTLFTGDRSQSSTATPELAPAMMARIIFAQEASRREGKFNDGQIKMLTGDDRIYYRKFHTEGQSDLFMAKSIYIGNRLIPLYEADDALKDRLLIFYFGSRWSKDAPKDPEEQWRTRHFPKDPNFDRKIERMPRYLLYELVRLYPEAMKSGITVTPKMQELLDRYWDKFDIYNQYTKNNLEVVATGDGNLDTNTILTVDSLFNSFSQWLQRSYPDALGQMSRGDVRMEFEIRKLGNIDEQIDGWRGWRLKSNGRGGPMVLGAPDMTEEYYD